MRTRRSYGYKVCYREENSKVYVRHFLTYTYRDAVKVITGYIRCPPKERETDRVLRRPTWKIIRVSRREARQGIWQEAPF